MMTMASHDAVLQGVDRSESAFGPVSSTREFDFTLTFEQSILSIIPSTLVLLIGPIRLLYLFHSDLKIFSQNNYYLLKVVRPSLLSIPIQALSHRPPD